MHLNHIITTMSKAISTEYWFNAWQLTQLHGMQTTFFFLVPYYVNVTYGLSGCVMFCITISQMAQFLDTVQLTWNVCCDFLCNLYLELFSFHTEFSQDIITNVLNSSHSVQNSRAVFVVGLARPRTLHKYHHDTKVKPEAATAVTELLMMGGKTPKTCWAVHKHQDNKLKNFCIRLVIYLN
jgi:hypothetical protein